MNNLPAANPSGREPAEIPTAPGACVDERVDVTHVEGMDEQVHTLGCDCGCEGDALIIKERGNDGAWLASTMDVERYMGGGLEYVWW